MTDFDNLTQQAVNNWYSIDPSWGTIAVVSAVTIGVVGTILAARYRRVVKPNYVHIVQSRRTTTTYGKGYEAGNSYYEWPHWWPVIGVQKIVLPLSVFDLDLKDYEAYDEQKVPFMVDIKAFFRIDNPEKAAERISDMEELLTQLHGILQGTVRTVLAKHQVEEIMLERSTFGSMFTKETAEQLKEWGVVNVKNIELMDVRDGRDSKTISNIMAKKESWIESSSRQEVAENIKNARVKEIEADQVASIREQEAEQLIGERTAEKNKKVGIADQIAQQEIKEQARITAEKDMKVVQVKVVQQANIEREAAIVHAEQTKQTNIIEAEGKKQQTITVAEGDLRNQQMQGEGILAVGQGTAEAKRLTEMARVSPELALAEQIGENPGYQDYLVRIRVVEKDEAVGKEQAKALQDAGIKVIANTGSPIEGVNSVMDLFSSKGGTHLGAMLEGMAQTDVGQAALKKFGINPENTPTSGNGANR